MRNLIAERLIQSGNFFFPCRHARDGCRFEAARERLGAHERGCPARPVPCPDGGAAACGREGGTVPLNQVGRVEMHRSEDILHIRFVCLWYYFKYLLGRMTVQFLFLCI